MLPERLSTDLCSLRPAVERRCVTVEVPFDGDSTPASRSSTAASSAAARGSPTRRPRRSSPGARAPARRLPRRCGSPSGCRTELRRRRFRARRAADRDGRGRRSPSTARAGGAGLDRGRAARARARRGADDPRERDRRRALAGRRREALYRVHERPDPQSIELLVAKLEALEVPTPPVPEHLTPGDAARLAARISARVAEYADAVGPRREAVPLARAARAEAGPLRPPQPRPLRPCEPGVLPLHVADPSLPGPRSSTARCCASSGSPTTRPGGARRARRVGLGARARGRARSSTARTRSASPGSSSGGSSSSAGTPRFEARSSARSAPGSSSASTGSSRATCRRGASPATTSSSTRSASALVGRRSGRSLPPRRRHRGPGRADREADRQGESSSLPRARKRKSRSLRHRVSGPLASQGRRAHSVPLAPSTGRE